MSTNPETPCSRCHSSGPYWPQSCAVPVSDVGKIEAKQHEWISGCEQLSVTLRKQKFVSDLLQFPSKWKITKRQYIPPLCLVRDSSEHEAIFDEGGHVQMAPVMHSNK